MNSKEKHHEAKHLNYGSDHDDEHDNLLGKENGPISQKEKLEKAKCSEEGKRFQKVPSSPKTT